MRLFITILLTLSLGGSSAFGQPNAATRQGRDFQTLGKIDTASKPFVGISGKRAGLYSAILPGLGQALNHQYWKIPIIYAGGAVAAYFIYTNRKNYNEFRSIYIGRLSNDPKAFQEHPELTTIGQVQTAMNYYQHYLDLSVVLTVAGYALQIIDAVVFANLRGFDISPDISLRFSPVVYPNGGAGFGLVMAF